MTDSSLNKDKLKELITKINITLRSKEHPSEEDIIILKNLFMNMKKPCFLLGLLSFYERTKQPSLISFVKENISIFENDFSLKANQLYVVYYALTNQECDPKRMLLEENFFKKYKSIFTDWFKFSYFDSLPFNPILGEEFGENFLAINERKKIRNFFSENEIEKDFLECYFLISNEKYTLALSKLNLFLKKLKLFPKNLAYYLHSYNLISFCLFYNGYFIESITYLEMAGKLIQNDYFDKVIRLIKEGKGPMNVFIKELNSNYTNLKKIKDFSETEVDRFSLENKRLIFNLQTYNHFILRDLIFEEKDFLVQRLINKTKIKDLYSLFEDLFKRNVLSVHKRGNYLVFTHYPSMLTQKIKITFDLKPILEKSKKTFLMKIETKKDKQIFYKNRKRLDDKIAEKVTELNNLLIFDGVEHLLVGDFEFPFEKCAKLSNCKRIFKLSGLKIDKQPSSIFYVLDPQNKLPKTKERLMPLLKKYDGVVNRSAIQSDIKYTPINLLYFGHGNGQSFLNFKCDTESVYLFGCSSAKRFFFYGSNVHGAVYKYKCNKFIGCLWDISDKDIDLISKEYLVSGNLDRNVSRYEYLSGA